MRLERIETEAGGLVGVYTKGAVDPADFARAVADAWGVVIDPGAVKMIRGSVRNGHVIEAANRFGARLTVGLV